MPRTRYSFSRLSSEQQPAAHQQTQWLLNPRLPFTSVAFGMFSLTRIRPETDPNTRVVVSSHHDAFGEVGVIDLPSGPRSCCNHVLSRGS